MDRLRERLAEKLGATRRRPPPNDAARGGARRSRINPRRRPQPPRRSRRAVAPKPEHAHAAHWSYEGEGGPASWGAMKPEFARCASGTRQSPIDIREGIKVQLDLVPFDYKAERLPRHRQRPHRAGQRRAGQQHRGDGAALRTRAVPLPPPLGRTHRRPPVRQWSCTSCTRIRKAASPWWRCCSSAAAPSRWCRNLEQPAAREGRGVPARDTLDLGALLPSERFAHPYMGSLTTPPCSEGVLWMVMKQPRPSRPTDRHLRAPVPDERAADPVAAGRHQGSN